MIINFFDYLKAHHKLYAYKRGGNAGDAPADSTRRAKSWFRVLNRSDNNTFSPHMAVLFHRTNIIMAYPDGRIVVDAGGYEDSPTTRDAFAEFGVTLFTRHSNGLRQTMIRGASWWGDGPVCEALGLPRTGTLEIIREPQPLVYYDGMEFDRHGMLVGTAPPKLTRRVNRTLSDKWRALPHVVGFRQALPLLYAAQERMAPSERFAVYSGKIDVTSPPLIHCDLMGCTVHTTNEEMKQPELWPALVAKYFIPGGDYRKTWSAINSMVCGYSFTETVDAGTLKPVKD
jgi:hypothetical protein